MRPKDHSTQKLNPMPKSVPCSPRTHIQSDRQTHTKVTTVGILSGFQEFFLELSSRIGPIMTCRQNMIMNTTIMVFFVFFKCPPRVILVYSFGGRGGGAYKYNLTPFWVPSSFLTNDPHVILSTGSQCHFNKSKVH